MLNCTITSPLDKYSAEGLSCIDIETVDGQRGILNGHMPLVAQLKPESLVRLIHGKTELHIRLGQSCFFKLSGKSAIILTQDFTKLTEEFCPI